MFVKSVANTPKWITPSQHATAGTAR